MIIENNEITILEAIEYIQETGNNLPSDVYTIGYFDTDHLFYDNDAPNCYNHNYYNYYGTDAILLEESNDDNIVSYYVCDNEYKVISLLGHAYDWRISGERIIELYPYF